MYNVLAVDDDRTCLRILKACLEKWNYQVTPVKHPHEALSMLGNKYFDLVLTDLHMPDMNGFELQERINQEFSLPVILISSDTRADIMCMGFKNGAQHFFVKPVVADDLKDIWQFAEWWKTNKNNNTAPLRQINHGSSQESVAVVDSHNGRRIRRLIWTSDLHNRFVEALLVIGYHRAVPTNILEAMNVEGLTKGQIASHLQKFQKFLQRVLDGKTNVEFSSWTDLNYYSSLVSGNPTLVLLNQLRYEQRKGKLAAHNPLRPPKQENTKKKDRAPNGALSSFRRLPPLSIGEGSSSRSTYVTLMPANGSYSSVNVASRGFGSATLPNAHNENMGSIVGSSTSNFIHNLSSGTNQMDYCNQTTLAQERDNYSRNRGLNREANNNVFPSANNVAPSCFALRDFYPQQSFNVGEMDNSNIYYGNNFYTDQLTQLGNNLGDTSIGITSDARNISAMNAHQLGDEQITDGSSFKDSGREDGNDY